MKWMVWLFFCCLVSGLNVCAQDKPAGAGSVILPADDLVFLRGITHAVLEKARLYPGGSGENKTGGVLIRPGGAYPSFWIRDYAMSLESGLVSKKEQEHMLMLTAATQCNQSWITRGGSLVPFGAIADHIRTNDGLPIFFPGTNDYAEQGVAAYGKVPPYDDQFYFIHMAFYFVKNSSGIKMLRQEVNGLTLMDRLEIAFQVPPSHEDNGIVYSTDAFRGVDFGFRDAEEITGDLCFASLLKFRAADELSALFLLQRDKKKSEKYHALAQKIKTCLPGLFADERGLLRASTGKSRQADVWGTALAVYWGLLDAGDLRKAAETLARAYENKTLAYKGNIRHVLVSDDFSDSTAWEFSLADKNTYQNGAYWGTPTGWVCYAIALVNPAAAQKLAGEYIADLRETDFRKGKDFGGPFECFNPAGYHQNPAYLTTVSCPYAVFRLTNTIKTKP